MSAQCQSVDSAECLSGWSIVCMTGLIHGSPHTQSQYVNTPVEYVLLPAKRKQRGVDITVYKITFSLAFNPIAV